jgi:hypothetical protein
MKTILVFIIQAHQGESPDGNLSDCVTLELIDKDVDSAVKRAQKMVEKKFYRVKSVIEKEIL